MNIRGGAAGSYQFGSSNGGIRMFGICFIKFDSMTYVISFKKGRQNREGRGLAFYYHEPTTSISAVPLGSRDIQFIFQNTTADFQAVSVQGQITCKIENPKQIAELLDFTVDKNGAYKSEDPAKLDARLVNEAQAATAALIQGMQIRDVLRKAKEIERHIFDGLAASQAVQLVGVVPLAVNVVAVKPTPEMAKALETQTREELLKEADEAIYRRRKFSVEEEQKIRESELNTEIAVEEKKKQIAEKKMEAQVLAAQNERKLRQIRIEADIAIEKERTGLIDMKSENERKDAETRAYVLEATLKPYRDFDWKLLMAMQAQGADPQANIALAFRELAEKAEKVGNLNITPELLDSLIRNKQNK